jgi:hypothetical protein
MTMPLAFLERTDHCLTMRRWLPGSEDAKAALTAIDPTAPWDWKADAPWGWVDFTVCLHPNGALGLLAQETWAAIEPKRRWWPWFKRVGWNEVGVAFVLEPDEAAVALPLIRAMIDKYEKQAKVKQHERMETSKPD